MSIFLKYIDKIQVTLKSDKNNGYFTQSPIHTSMNIHFINKKTCRTTNMKQVSKYNIQDNTQHNNNTNTQYRNSTNTVSKIVHVKFQRIRKWRKL